MTVETSIHDGIATLVLNRPEFLNSLSERLLVDLNAAIDEVEKSSCRGVVITGAGDKAFCAGADIVELQERSLAEHRENVILGQSTFNRISALAVPSVAVIHGYAFGGGLELALACTFRVATANAKMGLPEVKLGLIPGYGGTQRLPRLVGESRALELILSGKAIGADEALRIGLVNCCTEQGNPGEIGAAYLKQFTPYSLAAGRLARECVQRGLNGTLADGLAFETNIFMLCSQTADAVEGMDAFLKKRAPLFKDC